MEKVCPFRISTLYRRDVDVQEGKRTIIKSVVCRQELAEYTETVFEPCLKEKCALYTPLGCKL